MTATTIICALLSFFFGTFCGLVTVLSWALSELVKARYPNKYIRRIVSPLVPIVGVASSLYVAAMLHYPVAGPFLLLSEYDLFWFSSIPMILGGVVASAVGVFLFNRSKTGARLAREEAGKFLA